MTHNEKIIKFFEDVKALGLKFPVAEITKATGYQKGTVSGYLKGKPEPSDSFIDSFYEKFEERLKKVPRGNANTAQPGTQDITAAHIQVPVMFVEMFNKLLEENGNLSAIGNNLSLANLNLTAYLNSDVAAQASLSAQGSGLKEKVVGEAVERGKFSDKTKTQASSKGRVVQKGSLAGKGR